MAGEGPKALDRIAHAPRAVRVDPDRGVRPERAADSRDLGDVAGKADLELEGPESPSRPILGHHPGRGRVRRREGRIADHRLRLGRSEQAPDGIA